MGDETTAVRELSSDSDVADFVAESDGSLPALLLFWAPTQEETLPFKDVFTSTAARWIPQIAAATVNTDRASQLFDELEYATIPMTTAFWNGERQMDAAGDLGEGMLTNFLNGVLRNAQPS